MRMGLGLGLHQRRSTGAVAPAGTILGNRYSDGDTFFTAVVTTGAIGITGALYSDPDAFNDNVVGRGAVNIDGALFSDADTFHAASVSAGGDQTVTGDFFNDTPDTFHAATVGRGAVNISTSLPADDDRFFAATVTGGGTPFKMETDLTGAQAVWDFTNDTTLTHSSNLISDVADMVNANDLAQTTSGDRPTRVTNFINGKQVAQFINGDFFPVPNFMSGFTAGTFVFAGKLGSATEGWFLDAGDAGTFESIYFGGTIYDNFGTTDRKTVGDPTPDVVGAWFIYVVRSSSGAFNVRLNGTQIFTTGTNTVGWTTTPLMGKTRAGSFGDFHLAKAAVTNTAISDTLAEKCEGELAHLLGITSVLDAGHPYKSSPPTA